MEKDTGGKNNDWKKSAKKTKQENKTRVLKRMRWKIFEEENHVTNLAWTSHRVLYRKPNWFSITTTTFCAWKSLFLWAFGYLIYLKKDTSYRLENFLRTSLSEITKPRWQNFWPGFKIGWTALWFKFQKEESTNGVNQRKTFGNFFPYFVYYEKISRVKNPMSSSHHSAKNSRNFPNNSPDHRGQMIHSWPQEKSTQDQQFMNKLAAYRLLSGWLISFMRFYKMFFHMHYDAHLLKRCTPGFSLAIVFFRFFSFSLFCLVIIEFTHMLVLE